MGTVGRKADSLAVQEDRGYYCNVREVSSAAKGIVEHDNVSIGEVVSEFFENCAHRVRHCSQMDWNMLGLRGQSTLGIEEGAGRIPPLLNVRRKAGTAKNDPHLLGNCRESVLDDLEC